MSEAQATHLKRQYGMLKTWSRSLENMIKETPITMKEHWDHKREHEMVQSEMNRIRHQYKKGA